MGKNDLKIGDKAIIFKVESYNAGIIDLAKLIGDQKIVLIFSRYFGCPICQLDLKTLLESKHRIEEKGAKILYITQSGEKIAKEYIEKENIDFPVIPREKQGPGQFVVEEQGKIIHASKGWLNIDSLLKVL